MAAKAPAYLQLTHDRVFYLTMSTAEIIVYIVKALINLTIEIEEIEEVTPQKFLQNHVAGKAVNLDIAVKAKTNRNIMIEMQILGKQNIARRIRYMISAADNQTVDRGTNYDDYPEHIVIFICAFDPFPGVGLQRYRIYNHNPHVPQDIMEQAYNNGVQIYLINLYGNPDPKQRYAKFTTAQGEEIIDDCVLSPEGQDLIRLMLDYNYEPQFPDAVKIKKRRAEVTKERGIVNMLKMEYNRDLELTRAGIAEGRAEGIAIGEARGIAIGEARGISIGEARGTANAIATVKQLAAEGLSVDEIIKTISQQPGTPAPA